ncbi:MAG: dihydrodipicolinate synthase family protein [Proteobacteria bacterium]|nr:dihydrodipicolinate synthase family protein [Pseudomonadota bacterium]
MTGDNNKPLQGVIPILATPFHDDGSVDYDSLAHLVDHLLGQGSHGLGVFGNAGEGYTLLPDEKRRILESVARRVNGKVPICVGVGETGTRAAVASCVEAQSLGADALMVLPPYYLRPDGDGLVEFYSAIGRAVAVPIMVQDAPLLTSVPMPPALLARLVREVEAVKYAKVEAPPTPPKITQVQQATDGDLVLLGGLNGQFMIEEITRGARGTMPASDMTSIYVEIWERLQAGDRDSAWECFTQALPLIRFELQPGLGVSAVKHNLVERGVIETPTVRSPTRSLDTQGLAELDELQRVVLREVGRPR